MTKNEYDSIRNEILQWQKIRYTLLSVAIIYEAALLNLKWEKYDNLSNSWAIISIVLLIFFSLS